MVSYHAISERPEHIILIFIDIFLGVQQLYFVRNRIKYVTFVYNLRHTYKYHQCRYLSLKRPHIIYFISINT